VHQVAIKLMKDPTYQFWFASGGGEGLTVRGSGASPLVGSAQDIR
jgi:hypothetical protein